MGFEEKRIFLSEKRYEINSFVPRLSWPDSPQGGRKSTGGGATQEKRETKKGKNISRALSEKYIYSDKT